MSSDYVFVHGFMEVTADDKDTSIMDMGKKRMAETRVWVRREHIHSMAEITGVCPVEPEFKFQVLINSPGDRYDVIWMMPEDAKNFRHWFNMQPAEVD